MTDLTIIIPTYNTKKITQNCLKSIFSSLKFDSSIKCEIIVVDNHSTDGTAKLLKKLSQKKNKNIKIKPIILKENLGYGKSNNLAVKYAKSDYLLFLNSDTEAIENAIPLLFKFYKQKEKMFNFLGGKLLNKNYTSQPSCGFFYSLPIIFLALFLKGDHLHITRFSPKKVIKTDWVSGACFITKKCYFNQVGGFDEKIFMYMEEIEFFYRARKKGLTVGFYPEAKFIHLGSASSQKKSQPIIQVYKGFLYLYKKHFPYWQLKILKGMLKLKAYIAIIIGKIIHNKNLIQTYAEALQVVKNN